jgi:hypothetical protein
MQKQTAARIATVAIAGFALFALVNGSLLGTAKAEPWSTPGTAINFVITGPGSPQVNVHAIECPAISVMASTGSAASCVFAIARTEPSEPDTVDMTVTATISGHSPDIELDKFTLDVVGGPSWSFNSLPQLVATEISWPWAVTPWTFESSVSWTDLSNVSLGGSVTVALVIDLVNTEATTPPTVPPTASPTVAPTGSPTPTPTLPDTGGTPTPTPTLPDTGGTPTPTPTLPDTSGVLGGSRSAQDPTGGAFLLIVVASLTAILYLYLVPPPRRKRPD